ncbi:hypothetical protein LXL04_002401 [Taraxacum kok-saghyz]
MLINSFLSSPASITSLINMYSKCNSISDAVLLFTSSSSSQLNVFAYNAIIADFIFNELPNPRITGLKTVQGMVFRFGIGIDHDLFVGSAAFPGYLKFG